LTVIGVVQNGQFVVRIQTDVIPVDVADVAQSRVALYEDTAIADRLEQRKIQAFQTRVENVE
jgi:hypothetical protein